MDINRNQYFLIGLVVLLLGLQARWVETYVLNERASRFVAERLSPMVESDGSVRSIVPTGGVHRTFRPPSWMGYALLSVGGVLILHSLAMKRPGG